MLSKHPGKCRFPHGHSRQIEVVLVADRLDANDMVCDFKAIKQSLAEFLDRWDHALCLNSADPQLGLLQQHYGERVVVFTDTDPTSEVLARAVFTETRRRLKEASAQDNASYIAGMLLTTETLVVDKPEDEDESAAAGHGHGHGHGH